MSCVIQKQALRILSLSYETQAWLAPPSWAFFWYNTACKISSLKTTEVSFIVGVIPKDGLSVLVLAAFFFVWQRQRSLGMFYMAQLNSALFVLWNLTNCFLCATTKTYKLLCKYLCCSSVCPSQSWPMKCCLTTAWSSPMLYHCILPWTRATTIKEASFSLDYHHPLTMMWFYIF